MENQHENSRWNRAELPPARAAYFYQAEGDPEIGRVVFALAGVCRAMDDEQPIVGNYEQMTKLSYLAVAARLLADQLEDRLTSGPSQGRRKPKLRAVAAGVPERVS